MMTAKQWARVRNAGVYGLRRGAWYPVVAEGSSGMIVLNVSMRNVPVPRDSIDLSDDEPSCWSVVQWHPQERGAQRASEIGFGLPECAGEFQVEWSSKC
jgi:hypothetical protein